MKIERCTVCGGSVELLGQDYIKCAYCGQVYDLSGKIMHAEQVYKDAIEMQNHGTIASNEDARKLLEGISGYKDSDSKAIESYMNVENIKIAAEEKRLEEERRYQLQLEENRKKAKIREQIVRVSLIGIAIFAVIAIIIIICSEKHKNMLAQKYSIAVEKFEDKQYEEARDMFEEIDDYADSKRYLLYIDDILEEQQVIYAEAVKLFEGNDYAGAIMEFSKIPNYEESTKYIDKCVNELLKSAKEQLNLGDYDGAKECISYIPETSSKYIDGQKLLAEIDNIIILNKYNAAVELYNNQQYVEAQNAFFEIATYEDANNYLELIGTALYEKALSLFDEKNYIECVAVLKSIDDSTEWSEYEKAKNLIQSSTDTYRTETENEALRILRDSSYDDFSSYLNGRVCDIYSSNDATKLIDQWKPVSLASLDIFSKENSTSWDREFEYSSGIIDNLGETHNNVLTGGGHTEVYHINGQYDRISGYAFIMQGCTSKDSVLVLEIADENDTVLYRLDLTSGDLPEEFVVDISNVTDLKITFDAFHEWGSLQYFGGISDFELSSVPD